MKINKTFSFDFLRTPFGKWDYFLALLFVFSALWVCAAQITEGYGNWAGDFAQYINEAIHMLDGNLSTQIANNTWMMDKSDSPVGPYRYPWAMALMLSPIYWFFGFNLLAFKMLGIVFYALFVGSFYLFCAKTLPRVDAIWIALLFTFQPFLSFWSASYVTSDIPFLFIGFWTIWQVSSLFDSQKMPYTNQKAYFNAILCGFLIAYASLLRSNGLLILFALMTMHALLIFRFALEKFFFFQRFIRLNNFVGRFFNVVLSLCQNIKTPYAWQAHSVIYFVFLLLYFGVDACFPSAQGNVHVNMLSDISLEKTLTNSDQYLLALFDLLGGNLQKGLVVVFFLAMPLCCVGIQHCVVQNKRHFFVALCLLNLFLLLILWPGIFQGFRFVFIFLPFLVFYVAKGMQVLKEKGQRIYIRFFGIPVALIILNMMGMLLMNANWNFYPFPKTKSGAFSVNSQPLWEYIQNNTPQNAIILNFKPRIVHLATQRLGFFSTDPSRLFEADYVLMAQNNVENLMLMMNENTPFFQENTRLIFENSDFKFYQVLKK